MPHKKSRRLLEGEISPQLSLQQFFGAGLEAPVQAAESGEQPGSRHGQVGFLWQQRSLPTATLDGETAADMGMSLEKRWRSVIVTDCEERAGGLQENLL